MKEETFLCPFWTTSKKCSVVKTVFNVSRGKFLWSFFWKKCLFFIDFRFLSELFQFFVERIPAGLPKQNSTCPPEILEENYFFSKKLWVFLPFSQVSERLSALWRKLFGKVVKTAFDMSMGSYWKDFSEKKWDNFHNSRTLSKCFSAFSRRLSSWFDRKNYRKF